MLDRRSANKADFCVWVFVIRLLQIWFIENWQRSGVLFYANNRCLSLSYSVSITTTCAFSGPTTSPARLKAASTSSNSWVGLICPIFGPQMGSPPPSSCPSATPLWTYGIGVVFLRADRGTKLCRGSHRGARVAYFGVVCTVNYDGCAGVEDKLCTAINE